MTAGDIAKSPHVPRGLGLVGHVPAGNVILTADLDRHPMSVGLPPRHVNRPGLLVVSRRVLGDIWPTRSPGRPEFTASDDACAVAVATQAGALAGSLRQTDTARDVLSSLDVTVAQDVGRAPVDRCSLSKAQTGRGPRARHPPLEQVAASPVICRLGHTTRSMLGVQLASLCRIDGSRQVCAVVAAIEGAPVVAEVGRTR